MLLLAALLLAQVPAAAEPTPAPTPLRLSVPAFGSKAEAEVRDLPAAAADAALRQALGRIVTLDRLTDPARSDSALAQLNAAAGKGPQKIDPDLFGLLERALEFCTWSDGIDGPLGGRLNELWGVRGGAAALPTATTLSEAVDSARCSRLTLDSRAGTADLQAGSLADLWGFAEGFAVDQALAVLRQAGSTNAWVRAGPVQRGYGPGPAGKGWWVVLPKVPGATASLEPFELRDRAVACLQASDRQLGAGGQTWAPYVQQQTGRPAEGVLMVVAVTDLAIDAQALGVTMFTAGARQGQLRLGSVRPSPSVLWLLGTGQGAPLTTDYRWSDLRRH